MTIVQIILVCTENTKAETESSSKAQIKNKTKEK